jgi:transketolase
METRFMADASVARSADLDQFCINTVRTLAMDAVERAQSGHPGTPMALAPLAYVLWTRYHRHNPTNPAWPARDRFVLSCGHASMLLYSLLHLTGYDLPLEEVVNFRQWGSKTPGHPEYGHAPGVETTTGPLGQGFANAVGMAIAAHHLAARFNRPDHNVVPQRVWVLASDGDLMEGISHEAASLAGHLKLGRLTVFYDDNRISIDGPTSFTLSDDPRRRFEAYGWHVLDVADGNDLDAIDAAIRAALAEAERPTLVIVRTHIAYGSPNKQDTAEAHGAPLGADEVRLTKENLGWPHAEPFTVPEAAVAGWRTCLERGAALEAEWEAAWRRYEKAEPRLAAELERRLNGRRREGWEAAMPDLANEKGMASRQASGKVLNAVAQAVPELMGGSADLAASNNTLIKGEEPFGPARHDGRNVYFGVREHAMASILNGMALHGGFIPYGATFLVFSDYMRPAIRLAAMMGLHVIYVFTHDSIGLGEDGPTHQPIEMLAALRAIPNLTVIRPADAVETAEAWRVALKHEGGPVALILTRQKLAPLDRASMAAAGGVKRGAYILAEAEGGAPRAILLASGSEVDVAVGARDMLRKEGIAVRVVSVPSFELFRREPDSYRAGVLPASVPVRVAVEAAHPMPWYQLVGAGGDVVGIERFGASAPYQRIYEEFGITPVAVADRVRKALTR